MGYKEIKKENVLNYLKNVDYPIGKDDIFNSITSDICKMCGQLCCCCNKYPCVFAPCDFIDINDFDYMKKILDTGLIYINPNYDSFYTIRPVGKRELYNYRYDKNTCIFYHYENGCMLEKYYRPMQGLLYIPKEDIYDNCKAIYTKDDIYVEYKKYQDILKELKEYQKNIKYDVDLFEVPQERIDGFIRYLSKKD